MLRQADEFGETYEQAFRNVFDALEEIEQRLSTQRFMRPVCSGAM